MGRGVATWLVTGAATGFGNAIAAKALDAGDRVIATARDPGALAKLVEPFGDRAMALALDVTDPAAADIVRLAEARIGHGIDVIVNAAGYALIGAVEEVSDSELRLLMETHFFGAVAVTRAALPGMRARRRGHIFNFSSIAGVDPTPGTAHYSAAKFAIEGFSEGLAKEVAGFGIKVTVVEPGAFQTRFFTGSSGRTAQIEIADYAKAVGPFRQLVTNPPAWCPGDPERGAEAIVRLALDPAAPMRLPLGAVAHQAVTAALSRRIEEASAFRGVSIAADFPEAAGRSWP